MDDSTFTMPKARNNTMAMTIPNLLTEKGREMMPPPMVVFMMVVVVRRKSGCAEGYLLFWEGTCS